MSKLFVFRSEPVGDAAEPPADPTRPGDAPSPVVGRAVFHKLAAVVRLPERARPVVRARRGERETTPRLAFRQSSTDGRTIAAETDALAFALALRKLARAEPGHSAGEELTHQQ